MNQVPKVSLIMPTYNEEEYVVETLNSIFAQTYRDFELIIVNDCSHDNTYKIIEEYLHKSHPEIVITIINHEKNQGIAATRQTGVNLARGKYIAFCSADDALEPDFLKDMVEVAEKNPNKVIFCYYKIMDAKGEVFGQCREVQNFETFEDFKLAVWQQARQDTMFVMWDCVLIPTEIHKKIPYWSEIRYGEDLQWLLESVVIHNVPYVLLPKVLAKYRMHPKNTTTQKLGEIHSNNLRIIARIEALMKNEKANNSAS